MSNINHHIRRLLARTTEVSGWRYWRVSILSHHNIGQTETRVRTMGFYTNWTGGTNMSLTPANAFGDDPGGSWPLSNVFDGATSQCIWNRSSFPLPIRIGYDFGTPMSLDDIPYLYWAGSGIQYNPRQIRIEVSNNMTDWGWVGDYYLSNINVNEYIWLRPPYMTNGEVLYNHTDTSGGTVTFTVPAGVSEIHMAVIGAGGRGIDNIYDVGGGAGGGAWANNVRVFPGEIFQVSVNYPSHANYGYGSGNASIRRNSQTMVIGNSGNESSGFGPGAGGTGAYYTANTPFNNGVTSNCHSWIGGNAGVSNGQAGGHAIWPGHTPYAPSGAYGGFGTAIQAGGNGTIGIADSLYGNAGASYGGGSRMNALPGGGVAVICWGTDRPGFQWGGSSQYVTY